MRKKTLTGLVIASTLAIGMIAAVGLNMSNVSKASSKKPISTAKEKLSEVDVALVENQAEEKYIVNLVSARTNQELNISDWEICLKYLEKNYDNNTISIIELIKDNFDFNHNELEDHIWDKEDYDDYYDHFDQYGHYNNDDEYDYRHRYD